MRAIVPRSPHDAVQADHSDHNPRQGSDTTQFSPEHGPGAGAGISPICTGPDAGPGSGELIFASGLGAYVGGRMEGAGKGAKKQDTFVLHATVSKPPAWKKH